MIWESNLNFTLAQLLRNAGLAVRAEKQVPGGMQRHDIEVKLGALTAVIEAKKIETPNAQKIVAAQADERLSEKTADIAIALCYPSRTTEDNMHRKKFTWAVRHPRKLDSRVEWTAGGLDALTAAILQLPNELGDPDMLAKQLDNCLDTSVSFLSDQTKRKMARSLDLPANEKSDINASAKRAMLVAATAIMFHSRLDEHLRNAPPKTDRRKNPPAPFADEWPPMTAKACADDDAPAEKFTKAWGLILAVDYRPIFETARKMLLSAPAGPSLTRAVSRVAEKVLEITSQAASLRHDLLGRIFHRILDSAKFDGSFYTSTAAATLLASLALREEDADWKDAKSIGNLKIADPSCGTGTLLMAAAERARDLANRAGDAKELEKILIENVLHGYDTNLTATHLAATTLGLLSPGTEFSKMNIERTFLGFDKKGKRASLGSLEFIRGGQPSLLGWAGGQQQVDAEEAAARAAEVPKFDLIIMNPPFTRDSLRHDQFSLADEKALKDREKELFTHYLGRGGGERVLHMSSQGNNFVVLADHLIRPGGKMAAVLPMVTATNPSSRGIRKFVAQKFHVETIIISHDPERPAFSENTGISELLLICRKKKPGDQTSDARLVALEVNPDTPARAMMFANAIAVGEKKLICATPIPAAQIAAGDWLDVRFLMPRLSRLFLHLREGVICPVRTLNQFGEILTGQAVRGVFCKTDRPQPHGMTALWDHKTELICAMTAQHDTHVSFPPEKKSQAEKLWERRGRLMLPARLGLPQTRSVAVYLSRASVGSGWCPFKFADGAKGKAVAIREKALCAYLNASIGILALMGVRDCRILSYPRFSKESVLKLPVPDFAKLSAKKTAALAAAFDANAKSELLPLRQMADCETRRKIDNAVADALGIRREDMDEIRELLPREPSVSGRRYVSLSLAEKR